MVIGAIRASAMAEACVWYRGLAVLQGIIHQLRRRSYTRQQSHGICIPLSLIHPSVNIHILTYN